MSATRILLISSAAYVMTLVVRNLQRSVTFSLKKLRNHVQLLMNLLEMESYSLGVIFVGESCIKQMNNEYCNINKPTDILSFPNHIIMPGKLHTNEALKLDENLGDIFLCPSVIRNHCVDDETDFQNSLPVYVTHGICHLMGYTHHTSEDWTLMFSKEKEILSAFAERTGIICSPLTAQSN
ncbi:endoribonuclease YbeY-like isoform X1 [Xenia sp. Carnegie-2017]|uniref:endoribonuclease YbeY-like isoform X1 n=2 Tax=Xenia sp. Carnegie-2017 TaxID=2897299 RepID=UPI001F045ACE|nr:endoribonuclease YbeY-like isoform X1 [Xenia sp. Carnegie-2017]